MLIDTEKSFISVLPDLLQCLDPVVDTETTGLNPWGTKNREPDRVIGISIDTGVEAYYFPFRHAAGVNLPVEQMEFFRWYLSNSDRTIGGYNYKFDMEMLLAGDGVPIPTNIEDAMLSLHLLNENEPNFKLKDTCDRYKIGDGSLQESLLQDKVVAECQRLGISVSIAAKSPDNWKGKMWVLPASEVEPYACDDVRLTRALLKLHKPALQYWGLWDIFKQVCYYEVITTHMEARGILLDVDLIDEYSGEADGEYQKVEDKLTEMAGYKINVNSSKQVCAFLGVDSSASEILDILPGEAPKVVQLARGWKSVVSRYYTPYTNLCDVNNVLRTSLNLHGTISGRLSSTNPNLQAVARHTDIFKVKDVFIARPGYTLISMDYKQAEMRLACFYAKEETMSELIRQGKDLHSSTAELLGIPRDAAKRINFGVIYGIGKDALHDQLRIAVNTAAAYLKQYHTLYPGFRRLMNACDQMAQKHQFIRMWTGRMRHFDAKNPSHKAMSNLVQGGVGEIMRTTITRAFPVCRDLRGYMLLQVHDQVLYEIPDENVDLACKVLKSVMEDYQFDPKMEVDVSVGKSWGTLETWEDPANGNSG